jgi:exopolysaccharide biosynthesis polyprenyl glycosylphosphotransferase
MTAQPDVFEQAPLGTDVAYIRRPSRARVRRGDDGALIRPSGLRRTLVVLDVVMVLAAWTIALSLPTSILAEQPIALGARVVVIVALTASSLLLFAVQHLYLARVCGVRSVELNRLGLAAALIGGTLFVAQAVSGDAGSRVVVGAVLMFVFTAFGRSAYDAWLKTMRAAGRYSRPIVMIGANDESLELAHLLRDHPEFGYAPVGVVGDTAERVRWNNGIPWLGGFESAAETVVAHSAGALVAVSALTQEQLNRITRDLLKRNVHVHLSPGLRGISHRRLRALPISHEPIFYLEAVRLARWKLVLKRMIDVTVAATLLLLTLPLMIAAAIAIKLQDRGPVLYRQVRVGRKGEHFTLLKLRTMRPGADAEIQQVTGLNERDGGPLFKAAQDPRRTKVGRILELSSLDEIPQLVNVLRGQMSLVGPRPALPEEVARFDAELYSRHDVPPGITGLWQVEARDNPSFAAYRRLDLFYVENWSVAFDLAIAFATVRSVLSRLFRASS